MQFRKRSNSMGIPSKQRSVRSMCWRHGFVHCLVWVALPLFLLFGTTLSTRAQGITAGDGSWVWQNPLPQGNHLYDVWVSPENSVWAVGEAGTILKWTGGFATLERSGTTHDLRGIWGVNDSNIWVVGSGGTILHWNGLSWLPQESGTTAWLDGVWGLDTSNIWAVGDNGTILRWDGSVWNTEISPGGWLTDVWGSNLNNLWAVGSNGIILKRSGSVWTSQNSGTSSLLHDIWGSDSNHIWVVGDLGTLLAWNGSAWNAQISGTPNHLQSIWGLGANDIWIVGDAGVRLKWDGSIWHVANESYPHLFGVSGSATNNVWAVGEAGILLNWDGNTWTKQSGSLTVDLFDIWGVDANRIWVIGWSGTLLTWDGNSWARQNSGLGGELSAIWGDDPSRIWVAGSEGIIFRWNGTSWVRQESGTTEWLWDIWGTDAANLWAVGRRGTLLRWNGSSWSAQNSMTSDDLYGIWGIDTNDVWVVGDRGVILRWNGSAWSQQDSGVTSRLNKIWGTDANNIWVVGDQGTILRWDGNAWSSQHSGTIKDLHGIWGVGAENIWVVGNSGKVLGKGEESAILKWDGVAWQSYGSATFHWLYGVWGVDANNFWIVGDYGMIQRSVTHKLWAHISSDAMGSVAVAPQGVSCGVNCTDHVHGTVITMTATTSGAHSFVGWSGACNGAGACSVLLDADKQVTATFATLTPIPTPISIPTPTPTVTPTLTPIPTSTSIPTPPPTVTPSPTPTPTPIPAADTYEPDDDCPAARTITVDGANQDHTFHRSGDVDWVQFAAVAGQTYRVEVQPPLTSLADVDMEIHNGCESVPVGEWHETFTPSIRMDFTPSATGPLYLRLANHDANAFGAAANYSVLVRTMTAAPTNRALVIVAGRLRGADHLQANIHNLAEAAYTLFARNGYPNENIYLLATNASLDGYDAAATRQNLRGAITTWARDRLSPDGVFTLYMVDHGTPGIFYLDELNGQRVTPGELDGWLSELEAAVAGLKVNVIIEACQSGSFIGTSSGISKPGRVVLTSSDAQHDAMASLTGAYFSDHLLTWLHQGYNLAVSFDEAQTVARQAYSVQEAWLDADGDGVPNEFEDATVAARRSFAYAGTLAGEAWPPHIFSVQPPAAITNHSGVVQVDVRDDVRVAQIWGVVYPPGYAPPATAQELQPEILSRIVLAPAGEENIYAGRYDGFTQTGVYRIVINAVDNEGLVAAPRTVEVRVGGNQVFLPAVIDGQ